ncbi:MAG TPA: MBL fold metallo-hydrolase, partial [Sphingomonas sp.]
AGLNILTDPVWSDTAGPFGFGPKRVAKPGIAFDDLPRIDLIVVSHNHYDHMDLATLKRLWDRDRPRIVTSLGNDAILRAAGIGARAVDWGGHLYLVDGKLTDVPPPIACAPDDGFCAYPSVTVVRNHHWGSRWFADRNRALWSAFVIRTRAGAIFFAGDTGLGDGQWPAEAARMGPIRLAIIPIGAFRFQPGQMSSGSHIGPVQAVEVFRGTGATTGIPIHWGTFRLSYEGYTTPPQLLGAATRCAGVSGFDPVQIGRAVEVRPVQGRAPLPSVDTDRCLDTPAVRSLR